MKQFSFKIWWKKKMRQLQLLHWHTPARGLLWLTTVVALTAIVYIHLGYFQIGTSIESFHPGMPAPRDIITPVNISWEDSAETLRLQQEAADNCPIVYARDPKAINVTMTKIDDLFSDLSIGSVDSVQISDESYNILKNLTVSDRLSLQNQTKDIIRKAMESGVVDSSDSRKQAEARIKMLADTVNNKEFSKIISAIGKSSVLQPTEIPDDQATQNNRVLARNRIPKVIRVFKSDEVIIRAGQIITADDIEQLNKQQAFSPVSLLRLIPVALLTALAVTMVGAYLRYHQTKLFNKPERLLLVSVLIVAPLWATLNLGYKHSDMVCMTVIPCASMMLAGLLGIPVAIISTTVISLLGGLISDQQFGATLLSLGSAITGILVIQSMSPASKAINAVLILSVTNFLLQVGLVWTSPGAAIPFSLKEVGWMALWASEAALLSSLIAVGAISILARPFGILTNSRLLELSNSKEVLLRRLMNEAPGSYHSSVMVANMAEAAADAIGANSLLAKVSALYHDVGKLKRPAYFAENQVPLGTGNPHEKLSARMSVLILTSHPRDGGEMVRQNKFPDEVAMIIREHHGTTLAAYFYHRARNESNGKEVSEDDFRYPGPLPSSRESAVVMLADQTQASVKSLREATPQRIEWMVDEIIKNRLDDGQFADCDITLRDLRIIKEVFVKILTGLYTYTRLEYPDVKGEKRGNSNTTAA
jgi:putative nucleotidyltransferase with HDIG domain